MSNQTPLAELRNDLHQKLEEINELSKRAEAGEVLSDEELTRSETGLNEIDSLKNQIKSLELSERVKNLGKPSNSFHAPTVKVKRSVTQADYNESFKAWMLGGDATRRGITDNQKRSADMCDVDIYSNQWITRDQTTDTDTEGKELLTVLYMLVSLKAKPHTVVYCLPQMFKLFQVQNQCTMHTITIPLVLPLYRAHNCQQCQTQIL